MIFCPCLCRTSHRVIVGEHDRSSNAEDIQVIGVGKVGDEQPQPLCLSVCSLILTIPFPVRWSNIPTTTASPSTTTSCSSSWPPLLSWTSAFPPCAWPRPETTSLEEWSVWPPAGAWPGTTVRPPALSWPVLDPNPCSGSVFLTLADGESVRCLLKHLIINCWIVWPKDKLLWK